MRRRSFLALGVTTVAGCSETSPGPTGTRTGSRTAGTGTAEPTGTGTGTETGAGTGTPDGAPGTETRTEIETETERPTETTEPAVETRYGTSLSPRSFGQADFRSFVERAGELGGALRWGGDWAELGREEGGPETTVRLAARYGLTPVVEVNVFDASTRELDRPLSAENRERYVSQAAAFAERFEVPYLGLGVETNLLRGADADAFDTYVDLFAEAAAVHEAAPETRVYPGFQLEQLRGLRGGLFGGENDPDSAHWGLTERFPEADLLGFTTYPGLVYRDPTDVPADYYDAVAERVDRPVVVSEVGWVSETVATGWESDEAEQAAFVRRWFDLVGDLELALACYAWMYDPEDPPAAFAGLGLRRDDGTAKPAWDAWVDGVGG